MITNLSPSFFSLLVCISLIQRIYGLILLEIALKELSASFKSEVRGHGSIVSRGSVCVTTAIVSELIICGHWLQPDPGLSLAVHSLLTSGFTAFIRSPQLTILDIIHAPTKLYFRNIYPPTKKNCGQLLEVCRNTCIAC